VRELRVHRERFEAFQEEIDAGRAHARNVMRRHGS
jgi:hypothetical protein